VRQEEKWSLREAVANSKYLFLLPWIAGFVLFTAGPFLASFLLSFTDFDLFRAPHWMGLKNYDRMLFHDRRFWQAIEVTFVYVIVSVPLNIAVALGIALGLTESSRSAYIFRAIYYIPSFLGGSVAIAVLWRQVFGRDGLVNAALAWFGIHGPSWITDPNFALTSLIALNVWQFGIPMVLFIAGLKQIPAELYEAAKLDGASAVRRFWHVTVPMLTPIVLVALIFQVIGSFQAFTQAFIISGGTGGPSDSTLFFTLYIYQEAFTNFRMGYASALSWVLVVIIAAASALLLWSSKRWVHYGGQ
jgi:multiple sugar transport system permease protein